MLLTVCIPFTFLDKNLIFRSIKINIKLKKKIQFSLFLDGDKKLYNKFFIQNLKKKFNNPTIIFNKKIKNSGVSFARNQLIKSVKTNFFTFLDADDILKINKQLLFRISECLKKDHELLIVNHKTQSEKSYNYNMTGEIEEERILELVKQHLKFPKGNSIITHCWGKFYSTKFIKKNKIKFDTKKKVLEDYEFVANVFKYLKKGFIDKNIYYYHFFSNQYSYKMALRHLIYSKHYIKALQIFSKLIKPKNKAKFYFNKALKYWIVKQKKICNII